MLVLESTDSEEDCSIERSTRPNFRFLTNFEAFELETMRFVFKLFVLLDGERVDGVRVVVDV